MSKLFDRLKNAARARSENAFAGAPGGLLSQALQRAEAERVQTSAANDQMAADPRVATSTGEGVHVDNAAIARARVAREVAARAARSERGLRAAKVKKRMARGVTRALLALGALAVAVAVVAWHYAPPRAVPVPVFQLDHTLRM